MNSVDPQSFSFSNRGLELAARKWLPIDYARGVVIFVHGWGDHAGRYHDVAQHLTEQDYAAYAFDFEGHGQSPGRRAFIANFQHLVDDLARFIDLVSTEMDGVPIFLCGYSMGGCVCATYLAFHPHQISGVIFNASALAVSKHISPVKKFMARALGGVLPSLPLAYLTAGELMSRDPRQIAAYEADELTYHGRINAGTGKQLLLANERIGQHLDRITVPFLVLQGGDDRLVDPEGAKTVYHVSPVADKKLHLYPNALHDLFHDSHRELVVQHLQHWLDEHSHEVAIEVLDEAAYA